MPTPGNTEEDVDVGGGTFSQEQVNAIVKDRLARQKAALLSQYATQVTEGEEAKKQLEQLKTKAQKYDALFKKGLEERRKKLPASVVILLDKLEPDEQVAWMDANADKLAPVTEAGPQTPKPKENQPAVDAAVDRKVKSGQYGAL